MFLLGKKKVRSRARGGTSSTFRSHIIKGVLSILGVSLCIGGIYYVTHLPLVTITTITVEGGETISHEEVRAKAENTLVGTYLGIIPKRFVYLYPHEAMRAVLLKIPRIRTVNITPHGRHVLHVAFTEYIPQALWCSAQVKEEPCYFLSHDGIAFAKAPMLEGGAFLRYYTESDEQIEQGDVIDEEKVAQIEWLEENIEKNLSFRINAILLKNNEDIELSVNGGGLFLISSKRDVKQTFANLQTVLTSESYDHIAPGNFQYVDVRFDKKVFINEEPDVTESDISSSTPSEREE